MKRILIIVFVIIVIVNLQPVKWLIGSEDLYYSNANGSFTYDEVNYTGRNYQLVLDNFQAFKAKHDKDTVLYRITSKNILKFWRWGAYLTQQKYKLQYRDWEEIKKVRGPITNKTGWQNF